MSIGERQQGITHNGLGIAEVGELAVQKLIKKTNDNKLFKSRTKYVKPQFWQYLC